LEPLAPCRIGSLEDPPKLEKPFAVAGVADAAADEERAHGGFCQESCRHIVRKVAIGGYAIHLANFIGANRVDFFPKKRREREQIMHVARADQIDLVTVNSFWP